MIKPLVMSSLAGNDIIVCTAQKTSSIQYKKLKKLVRTKEEFLKE